MDGTACIPLYFILNNCWTWYKRHMHALQMWVSHTSPLTNGKQTLEHIINIETVWWLNTPLCLAHNTVTHTHHISRRQNATMATISPIRPPITPKEAPTATASEWYTNKQPIGVCLTVKHKHTPILMSGGCTLFLAWVGIRLQGLLDNRLQHHKIEQIWVKSC